MTRYKTGQRGRLWALVACIVGFTGCGESSPGGPTTPVSVPEDKILLVQYEGKYTAIKLSVHQDGSVTAYWWHQLKPGPDFHAKTVKSGAVQLYEKYQVTRRHNSGSSANTVEHVVDKGSSLLIKCDDLCLFGKAA